MSNENTTLKEYAYEHIKAAKEREATGRDDFFVGDGENVR